jgi:hypothetical protein
VGVASATLGQKWGDQTTPFWPRGWLPIFIFFIFDFHLLKKKTKTKNKKQNKINVQNDVVLGWVDVVVLEPKTV